MSSHDHLEYANCFQGAVKIFTKSIPKSLKHVCGENRVGAVLSMRKPGFHDSQVCEFRLKSRSEKRSGNKPETNRLFNPRSQKKLKTGTQNGNKIVKNLLPDHHRSPLLLPWSARVLPRCQNGPPRRQNGGTRLPKWPQRPKVEASGLTNDSFVQKVISSASEIISI